MAHEAEWRLLLSYWRTAFRERPRVKFFSPLRAIPSVVIAILQLWRSKGNNSNEEILITVGIIVGAYVIAYVAETGINIVVRCPALLDQQKNNKISESERQKIAIEENLKSLPRLPELVIHPEPASRYYTEVDAPHGNKVRGVYVLLGLTVEKSGEGKSVIRGFDLSVQETGKSYANLRPQGRNSIQTRSTHYGGLRTDWLVDGSTIVVKADDVRTGSLPFYLDETAAINTPEIHLTLTLTDREGNQAHAEFTVVNAEQ